MTKSQDTQIPDFMKIFDPDLVVKIFNPERFGSIAKVTEMDLTEVYQSNAKNFKAVQAANEAAAQSYRDLYER